MHIGKFFHAQKVTLFTIGLCITHPTQVDVAPDWPVFEGLKREPASLQHTSMFEISTPAKN